MVKPLPGNNRGSPWQLLGLKVLEEYQLLEPSEIYSCKKGLPGRDYGFVSTPQCPPPPRKTASASYDQAKGNLWKKSQFCSLPSNLSLPPISLIKPSQPREGNLQKTVYRGQPHMVWERWRTENKSGEKMCELSGWEWI